MAAPEKQNVVVKSEERDVTVEVLNVRCEAQLSSEKDGYYLWSYSVRITNRSDAIIKLIGRHWDITEAGRNVAQLVPWSPTLIGDNPILRPNAKFDYRSGVPLKHPSGYMQGSYRVLSSAGKIFALNVEGFELPPAPRRSGLLHKQRLSLEDAKIFLHHLNLYCADEARGVRAHMVIGDLKGLSKEGKARIEQDIYYHTDISGNVTFNTTKRRAIDFAHLFPVGVNAPIINTTDLYIKEVKGVISVGIENKRPLSMEAQKAELRAIVKDGQEAAVTADENLLVALFRKVPKQRRAAVLAFVRSASGTTTPSANKRNCKHGKTKLRGAANTELRAARLRATYELLVRDSDLANPELSNDERMSRAIHLRNTYDRLHKLVPSFHDDAEQLRLARKMLNNRAHQRRKAAELT